MPDSEPTRIYAADTARPVPARGMMAAPWRQLCRAFLALTGWKMRGDWPNYPKMVVVAAPHTSNWDALWMLAAAGFYQVKLRWMGKASLAKGPFGGLVRWLGCVPIDRSAKNDVVRQMKEAFTREERLMLAVPPEGTRGAAPKWKTGFYQIALAAEVPIVMSVLDYKTRTMTIAGEVWPSGDYESDIALIGAPYSGAEAKYPGKFVKPVA